MAVIGHLGELVVGFFVVGGYLGAAFDLATGRCGRWGLFGWRLTLSARDWVYRQASSPIGPDPRALEARTEGGFSA